LILRTFFFLRVAAKTFAFFKIFEVVFNQKILNLLVSAFECCGHLVDADVGGVPC
jgi:hypothetical protein